MKKQIQAVLTLALCSSFLMVQGCATIMNGSRGSANIRSTPSGAKFVIKKNGTEIHNGVTPEIVQLERRGRYSVRLELDGYEPVEAKLRKGVSGWYIGNLLFGGLIGILIVDPITGAMFTFPDKKSHFTLQKKLQTFSQKATKGVQEGVVFLSLNDIPEDIKSQLVPIPTR